MSKIKNDDSFTRRDFRTFQNPVRGPTWVLFCQCSKTSVFIVIGTSSGISRIFLAHLGCLGNSSGKTTYVTTCQELLLGCQWKTMMNTWLPVTKSFLYFLGKMAVAARDSTFKTRKKTHNTGLWELWRCSESDFRIAWKKKTPLSIGLWCTYHLLTPKYSFFMFFFHFFGATFR